MRLGPRHVLLALVQVACVGARRSLERWSSQRGRGGLAGYSGSPLSLLDGADRSAPAVPGGLMAKSQAALNLERDENVRKLLAKSERDPEVLRAERQRDDLVCALFIVNGLKGREARTAWIENLGEGRAEVVVCAGFVW